MKLKNKRKILNKPYRNYTLYTRITNKMIKRMFTSKETKEFQNFMDELYKGVFK